MRRVVQEAVQQALAERAERSSSAATPTREQIRHMVAEEIAKSTHRPASSTSGSSAGQSSGSSSTSNQSSQKTSHHKAGWRRFRQGSSSKSGSSPVAGQGPAHESTESVAQVLGQAQWQLSEDLSANLKELRRVINQSQEIARKIEQVLGQGTSGQSE